MSLNRKFYEDYIGLDSHPGIKCLLDRNDVVKFAQTCTKYNRDFTTQSRDLVLTNKSLYIIGREKRKENNKKITCEVLKFKIPLNELNKIWLSPYRDNFVLIDIKDKYATLIELEYKTEFLFALSKRLREIFQNNKIVPFEFATE